MSSYIMVSLINFVNQCHMIRISVRALCVRPGKKIQIPQIPRLLAYCWESITTEFWSPKSRWGYFKFLFHSSFSFWTFRNITKKTTVMNCFYYDFDEIALCVHCCQLYGSHFCLSFLSLRYLSKSFRKFVSFIMPHFP